MLHAKFQDHKTSGSGEEDFLSRISLDAIIPVEHPRVGRQIFEQCIWVK